MRRLAGPGRMLSGLTVLYGNRREYRSFSTGLAQECVREGTGFLPSPLALTERTLYDLASLTKLFTAVAVLGLVSAGRLDLHEGIGVVDSRFAHLRRVPILDVLSYRAVLESPQRIDAQATAAEALAQVFSVRRVAREPVRLYSDMNALVLKYVVETVSGKRMADYVREHICRPAGMTDCFVRVPAHRVQDCVNYNYEHRILQGQYQLEEEVLPGLPHDPKARLLQEDREELSGHAGLFCTAVDMARFAMALLDGVLLPIDTVREMGVNRTGLQDASGVRRQYLGYLCFSKCPLQRVSEVPSWMGERSIALSGYTGNHLAIDPEAGVFDLFLGNRCHNRVSKILPESQEAAFGLSALGEGLVDWPDGRRVASSCRYIYRKDDMLHAPVREMLMAEGWLQAEP